MMMATGILVQGCVKPEGGWGSVGYPIGEGWRIVCFKARTELGLLYFKLS